MIFEHYRDFLEYCDRFDYTNMYSVDDNDYAAFAIAVQSHLYDEWCYQWLQNLGESLYSDMLSNHPDIMKIMLRAAMHGRPSGETLTDFSGQFWLGHDIFMLHSRWTSKEWLSGYTRTIPFSDAFVWYQYPGFEDILTHPLVSHPSQPVTFSCLYQYYKETMHYALPFQQEVFNTCTAYEQEQLIALVGDAILRHPCLTLDRTAFGHGYESTMRAWCEQYADQENRLLRDFIIGERQALIQRPEWHFLYTFTTPAFLLRLQSLDGLPQNAPIDLRLIHLYCSTHPQDYSAIASSRFHSYTYSEEEHQRMRCIHEFYGTRMLYHTLQQVWEIPITTMQEIELPM